MKNNGGKSNLLNEKDQEIKVNRKINNNNNKNITKIPSSQNYCLYYQQKDNKYNKGNKNVKYQEYLGPNNYRINNVFTEYDSSPKYSNCQLHPFKFNNLSPSDIKVFYNNTNGNINKQKNLNLKNKNKLNINNNDKALFKNYTNRELGKIPKLTNKANKKQNTYHNSSNSLNINSKNFLNQKNIFQNGNDTKYSSNIPNQIPKNKYHSNKNNLPKNNNKDLLNINFSTYSNKNEKMKKFNIISPSTNHNSNNKKSTRQNKHNLLSNKRKNIDFLSPEPNNMNQLSKIKNSNSIQNYRHEINTINTYNSCFNFYQKSNNNLIKKNNINMPTTINYFGCSNKSIGENIVEINKMNNNKKKCQMENGLNYKNENGLNYNKFMGKDLRKNGNDNGDINKNKIIANKINNKNIVHKKGKLSENNLNLYNNKINEILNSNINQLINYKKKLIQEFCHCLEEFIFMNVKNNFDTFISKLKKYNKEKIFNDLLLKRLQNKSIQKTFYKEKSSSYKYLEPDSSNAHYSSIIMMNNSNIINVQRKGDFIDNDFSKEYCGRKTVYNFRNSQSPPLTEKMDKIQRNFRAGKSHDPLDMNNLDNDNLYNNNTFFHNYKILENYPSYNNYNSNYYRRNIINNELFNTEDDEERRTAVKYDTNFNDINIYIPKKLKKVHNNNNRILSKSNERQRGLIDDSEISNIYIGKIKAKRIISKKLSPENEVNKSHDINNEMIKAKMKKNLNVNYLKKININQNNYFQDNSCDINQNYYIKQENENLLNKTNDIIIKRNNTQLTPGNTYDFKANDNYPIYKKKIKITKVKGKIYMNKTATNNIRNKMINLNQYNKTVEQILSPNFEQQNNKNLNNIENIEKFRSLNSNNYINNNNIRNSYTETRREINSNQQEIRQNSKFNKIQELKVNLSKNENNLKNNENSNNNNKNIIEKTINNINYQNDNNKNILKNEMETIIETKKENENKDTITIEENLDTKNENNTIGNENNTIENENNNTETIANNNDNNEYNEANNDNNLMNDVDTDESDENVTKEIIVKDVSTRDKRLNVFIKYVELSQFNTLNNEFTNINSINLFQTDSIFYPPLYQKQNTNYYYNYYFGNKNDKNNKIKLHKILSSIIEEEEKSKAAGSINNSYLSDEEINKNGNNYSNFFIQSIKYVSNFLQSIFDDKKKDMYFRFMKILKKIKNESFLKGLIDQKKFQTLKIKYEEKDNGNDNNNSSEIIIYNSKDKDDEKDNSENKNNINDNKKILDDDNIVNPHILDKKYSSAKNLFLIDKKYFNENILKKNKSCYPFDIFDLKENNNSFSSIGLNPQIKERKDSKNNIQYNKLRLIIENLEISRNIRLKNTFFKFWKIFKFEENEKNLEDKKEDSEIQMDYEKIVTISEACRGLSDVILDFKIFLIKYIIKNKKDKSCE